MSSNWSKTGVSALITPAQPITCQTSNSRLPQKGLSDRRSTTPRAVRASSLCIRLDSWDENYRSLRWLVSASPQIRQHSPEPGCISCKRLRARFRSRARPPLAHLQHATQMSDSFSLGGPPIWPSSCIASLPRSRACAPDRGLRAALVQHGGLRQLARMLHFSSNTKGLAFSAGQFIPEHTKEQRENESRAGWHAKSGGYGR
jgi:hypothetical protein